jgi:hypothetical protein
MKVSDWWPFRFGRWKLIDRAPYIFPKYLETPQFEIRRHADKDLFETWFYFHGGGETMRQRISAASTPYFVARWRNFLDTCEDYQWEPKILSFWEKKFGSVVLEDKLWLDDQGRYVGLLHLFREPSGNFKLKLSGSQGMDFQIFREWLDIIDEHHKPYGAPCLDHFLTGTG